MYKIHPIFKGKGFSRISNDKIFNQYRIIYLKQQDIVFFLKDESNSKGFFYCY